jgi:predicted transcriptional regulator
MKNILVRDVYQLHGTASISMDEESPLEDIISRFAHEPAIRGVFLIDVEQRFVGTVSRAAILKWADYQLFGKWKSGVPDSEVTNKITAVKAKYLARGDWHSLGVKEDDTLAEAFKQMMSFGEDIVPVIDDDGKVIGDLRLSEVLLKAIEVGREQKIEG